VARYALSWIHTETKLSINGLAGPPTLIENAEFPHPVINFAVQKSGQKGDSFQFFVLSCKNGNKNSDSELVFIKPEAREVIGATEKGTFNRSKTRQGVDDFFIRDLKRLWHGCFG
jgi:hypothetical protein